ncbi:MAG: tRNA pseudouridine(55) synthase TruB, partial [Bacteroidales bacterium]|nr:tRNA pseudouridine(55) synthase TruB [Bacteroidales bacterium]
MGEKFLTVDKDSIQLLGSNIDDYPGGVVIPIDKPYRWTSADVVRKVKFVAQKHFHKKNIKVGHAGTLDPLATGVLLVCLGKATKQAEALQAEQKEYIASIELGATTPCFDLEKEIDQRYPYEHITREMVEGILPKFIGEQDQIPPVFSAKLIDGTRAYEMARAGEEVVMKPARITIYDLEILEFELPKLVLRVKCSKGTYIRALGEDIGEELGCGGHLTALRRTATSGFAAAQCITLEALEQM